MTKQTRNGRWRRFSLLGGMVVLGGICCAGASRLDWGGWRKGQTSTLKRVLVRRADVASTLKTSGTLGSARNTLIEFEIERMSGSERDGNVSRYSTLTTVVPEGTYVQAGDVLCEVDASSYREQLRLQQITVEVSRSEEVRTRYDAETAEVSLHEYMDGLKERDRTQLRFQIALAQAELERQQNRIEWAERMQPLGYISAAQAGEERLSLLRCQTSLERAELALDSYIRFTEPRTISTLEAQLERSRSTHVFAAQRLETEEETLALYERQVGLCTIRAPHQGYVIYCVDDDDPPIAPGVVVRRHMDLFELPDLSQLEVRAEVNQALISRITEGMPARIRLDARAGRTYTGRVTHVAALPDQEDWMAKVRGISNFVVKIAVDSDEHLLPGLSAEVDLLTNSIPDSLVIPTEAVGEEDGKKYCYVDGPDGLERRTVDVDEATANLVRVTSGLSEGEEVLLDPSSLEPELLDGLREADGY